MKIRSGISVSRGIAIGQLYFYENPLHHFELNQVEDPQIELERFQTARRRAIQTLGELSRRAVDIVGPEESIIFEIHQMLLDDKDYINMVTELIQDHHCSAKYAVQKVEERLVQTFATMDNDYMKERSVDMVDISNRVLRILNGEPLDGLPNGAGNLIVAAKRLLPSEIIQMDRGKVSALLTSDGSRNSHSAILARAMGIPAVVMQGEPFGREHNEEVAIIDGLSGQVIFQPDEAVLYEYRQKRDRYLAYQARLSIYRDAQSCTLDGTKIFIGGSIGYPSDMESVLENGGDGIGMFRSDYLYIENRDFPTEQAQFEAYREVLRRMEDRKVVIRTLSIGTEKVAPYFQLPIENNSALGLRSIRFSLRRPDIFKPQLRALLRASNYGTLAILFPMVDTLEQICEIKSLLEDCRAELVAEGANINPCIELGVSIETPAAAILSDQLAQEVDFFVIDSNNLTQYTLAVDRSNRAVSNLYDSRSKAVLRLIQIVAKNAQEAGIRCGISGELAYNCDVTEILLNIGVSDFIVPSASILEVREKVCSVELSAKRQQALSQI